MANKDRNKRSARKARAQKRAEREAAQAASAASSAAKKTEGLGKQQAAAVAKAPEKQNKPAKASNKKPLAVEGRASQLFRCGHRLPRGLWRCSLAC